MSANPARRLANYNHITQFFSLGLEQCSSQAASYGKCVVDHVEKIQQGSCTAQWQALSTCIQQSLAKPRPKK